MGIKNSSLGREETFSWKTSYINLPFLSIFHTVTGPELQELLKSQRDSLSSLDFQPASIHIAATRRLKEKKKKKKELIGLRSLYNCGRKYIWRMINLLMPSKLLTWVTYAKHIRENKNVYRQVFAFMEVSIVG